MRILLLTLYFRPDMAANAVIMTDLAEELAKLGHHLTVVTSMPHYDRNRIWPEYRGKLHVREAFNGLDVRRVYLYFVISAVLIIGAGTWLAVIGEEIATITGLGESFVGTLLIGFSTTLPEITVAFAAMRIGAVDMAVANMIGSNLFNMAVVPIDDLLYAPGPVLNAVSTSHLFTAGIVIVMTGVFIAGLHFRPRRYFRVSWCSLTLIALFLLQAYLSYTLA